MHSKAKVAQQLFTPPDTRISQTHSEQADLNTFKKTAPLAQSRHRLHCSTTRGRDLSPSLSGVTCRQEDFYRQMQQSLLGENGNLKEQNSYLTAQVRSMFQREKRYQKALKRTREQLQQSEALNTHLQAQLKALSGTVMKEIQRLQTLLVPLSHDLSHDLPEAFPSEIDTDIYNNLEKLKAKVLSATSFGAKEDQHATYLAYRTQRLKEESQVTEETAWREGRSAGEAQKLNSLQEYIPTLLPESLVMIDRRDSRKLGRRH